MDRDVLTDGQWERIEHLLPGRVGHVGGTCKNNRLFVEAVLWLARTGSPWRDLHPRFGPWATAYVRFNRWAKTGVWERVFEALASDADFEYVMMDSTIVRAHQHAAGAKGGKTPRPWGEVVAALVPRSTPCVMLLGIQSALFLPQGRPAILPKRLY
jgi:putative transposase